MKTKLFSILVFGILIHFSTIGSAQEGTENRPPKEKWSLVQLEGRVTDINKDTREVTVMGPKGNLVTITADDSIERFDEIALNDIISFEYYTYLLAEFRAPTAQELEEPLVLVAEGGKAPEGMDPGAGLGAVVKAVVTVEVINRPEMIVTVKGPAGNYVSIEVEDSVLIEQLHVGEVVVLTYAEAMALTLEKVK